MLINQESIKLALRITMRSEKGGRVIALYVTGNKSREMYMRHNSMYRRGEN